MKLQVLGTGCAKCNNLAQAAETAASQLELDYELEKITDINQITAFGVMVTPALAIDGVVKVAGKVPDIDELKALLLTWQ